MNVAKGEVNVLVIGGGGREHAICWALKKSKTLNKLFCAPGNAGIDDIAERVSLNWEDFGAVVDFCHRHDIGLVVVGPEAPLAAGLADALRAAGVSVVGPGKDAARLESSKAFMREICAEWNIPSPRHACFTDRDAAKAYLAAEYAADAAVVIKADGLAAGKGVVIAANQQEAFDAVDEMFDGRFGEASSRVLVEEFLRGEEASFFFLCDGERALAFGRARDYKRVGGSDVGEDVIASELFWPVPRKGDKGENTGGMGAYSPVLELSRKTKEDVAKRIVAPALQAMVKRGTPFTGFLYAGVMITQEGVKLLEFNVRLGDPEAQVVLPRLRSDFLQLLLASCSGAGALAKTKIKWDTRTCLAVVLAAQGYPRSYQKGDVITGVERAARTKQVEVFHAGTKRDQERRLRVAGGRVLALSALGRSLGKARQHVYHAVERIEWPGGIYRLDIGTGPNESISSDFLDVSASENRTNGRTTPMHPDRQQDEERSSRVKPLKTGVPDLFRGRVMEPAESALENA